MRRLRRASAGARGTGRRGVGYGLIAGIALAATLAAVVAGAPVRSGASTSIPPTIDPTSLSFGTQAVGTSSTAQTVTVFNNDTGSDLAVYSDSIAPGGAFQIGADSCDNRNVPPQRSCQISVALAPTVAVGPTSATLSILEGFSGTPAETRTVSLTGTATGPPAITAQPASESVDPGQTASFTAAASAYPQAQEQWQVSADKGATWNDIAGATGGTYSITATAAASLYQYRAVFTNDLGTATSNAATLTVNTVTALTLSSNTLSFGNQAVDTTSTPHSVTLQNTGTTDVTLTPASFSLSAGGSTGINFDDSTATCHNTTIAPGSSCVLALTFRPPAVGPVSATLSITYGGTAPALLALSGTGVPPVTISPPALDFGQQAVGYRLDSSPVTLTNNLSTPLHVTGATVEGANAGDFPVFTYPDPGTCFAGPVAPGASCQVPVQFTPTVTGPRSATLEITDDSPGGQETVALSGVGVPVVTGNPSSVAFQPQFVGAIPSQFPTVTITNNGSDVVNFTGATIVGDTADFGTNPQSCGNYGLEHNFSCTVVVFFAPKTAGPHSATLHITDSAGVPVDIPLSGTGLVAVAPSITVQPQSQSVTAGHVASFTAGATGSPSPTVQWQVSTDGGNAWADIPGATATTYSFTTAPGDNDNLYRAVFTSSSGVATTDAARLTVLSAPAIVVQPASQTLLTGQTATFTAAATGNPTPTVIWQYSSDGGTTWNPLTGDTSPTLTIASVSANENGNLLRAVFTNDLGFAATNPATLTVTSAVAPSITDQPASQTVSTGQMVTFSAAASGTPPPGVRWQASTDGGKTFADVAGGTSDTLSFPAVDTDNGNQYRAVFTNAAGSQTTNVASLTVTPVADVAVTNTGPASVTAGNDMTYTISVTNNGPSDAQGVNLVDTLSPGTTFASQTQTSGPPASVAATGTTLDDTFASLASGSSASFAVVVHVSPSATGTIANTASASSSATDPNPADNAATSTATVDVAPAVTTQPTDQTVDAGQTATFAANATGIPAPSIQWQLSADAGQTWTDIPGATASPYSFPANSTESGDQFRAVFTNLAGSATTNPATLTVNTAPTVTTQPTSQSVTDGHTATFSAAASGSPSPAVRWQVSTDAGKTFADIPGATSPVYSLTAILGENGNQYRAVFTNVAGSATTLAATLTVVPALTSITVAPGGLTLAPGMTQAYTATGHYSNGTSKNLTTAVTWSSAAPGVASVSGGGLAKAISPGSADIAATLGSVSGHTGITVSPLRYIWVQPWIHFLPKRASIGYVATGLFANGTWEPITSHVSWTSTNRKVASVSPQGIATGLSRGWTLVSARFGRTYVIPGVLVVW